MGCRISSKDKILKAASELFYHVGYQATTVDDILARCGVAKSNFYYHYKSKEEVAQAVLSLRIAEYEAMLEQHLHNKAWTPTERLEHLFETICKAQAELQHMGGCPIGTFAASLPTEASHKQGNGENCSPDVKAELARQRQQLEQYRHSVATLFQRMQAALHECLHEGRERGEFRHDLDCADMAGFLVAALQGLLMMAKTHRDPLPLRRGMAVLICLLRAC